VNVEHLEHELCLLNNKFVVVVRPGFGQQSDSWIGRLTSNNDYPRKFTLDSDNFSMIFFAEDVVKLDEPINEETEKIIRLKGPNDYVQIYQTTH
jgi:hypothetical protein